jgi:hypothetical protein
MKLCGVAQWGDVPTWLSAIATIIAVVFAVWAARTARSLYLIESRRDEQQAAERRERDAERRQSQAGKVAVWFGWRAYAHATFGSDINEYGAFVHNTSGVPIYDVRLDFMLLPPRPHGAPGDRTPFVLHHERVVPPSAEPLFYPIDRKMMERLTPDVDQRKAVSVAMTFRDSENRSWRRTIDGHLLLSTTDLQRAREEAGL